MLSLTLLFFIFFGLGEPNLVIDHDGTVDDLISAVLQLKYNPRRVKGIVIAPADSFAQPDVWFTKMMIKKFRRGLPEIPYGFTIREGINLFPHEWRNDSWTIARLPFWANATTLNQTDLRRTPSSIATFIKVLEKFDENETDILTTGPMNNVADILIVRPELQKKIRRVFAMGGAINVKGNVEEKDKDGSQEWNAYNDPMSFDYVLKSGINLTLVPLDATQYTPITPEFKEKLRAIRKTSNHSELIAQALDIIEDRESSQFFWDTLTSMVALDPTIVKTEKMHLYCIQKGQQEGRTLKTKGKEAGGWVDVAVWANQTKFEQAVLDVLAGNFTPPTQEVVEAHYAEQAKAQAEAEAKAAAAAAAQAAAEAQAKARAAAKWARKQKRLAQMQAQAQAEAKAKAEAEAKAKAEAEAKAKAEAKAPTQTQTQKKPGEL